MNTTQRKYVEQGLCRYCGKKPETSSKTCEECKDRRQAYKLKVKQYCVNNNLCMQCTKNMPVGGSKYCTDCITYRRNASRKRNKKYPTRSKEYHRKIREEVIMKYGGVCVCCGETQFEFLAIDHKNGDGGAERRKLYGENKSRSASWCLKLKREPHRKDLRVLCHNCNMARAMYGKCPHENAKGQTESLPE